MLNHAKELIIQKLSHWLDLIIINIPNILAALITIIIFFVISKYTKPYLKKILKRFLVKNSAVKFALGVSQFIIIFIGFIIALSILNLSQTITSLLAGAGVAGLIVGFALKEILSSYFSGVTLSISKQLSNNDFVEVAGQKGTVKQINIRTTIIKSTQGQIIEIPNTNVINQPIINYTTNGKRRIDIKSGIAYDSDMKKAKQIAIKVVNSNTNVDKNLPVEFYFHQLGDSSINFLLRFWINFGNSQADYYQVKSDVITKLLDEYDKNNIILPYPTKTIKLENN